MLIPRLETKVFVEIHHWTENGRPSYHSDGSKVLRVVESFVNENYDESKPLDHPRNSSLIKGRMKVGMPLPDREWTALERLRLISIARDLGVPNPIEK